MGNIEMPAYGTTHIPAVALFGVTHQPGARSCGVTNNPGQIENPVLGEQPTVPVRRCGIIHDPGSLGETPLPGGVSHTDLLGDTNSPGTLGDQPTIPARSCGEIPIPGGALGDSSNPVCGDSHNGALRETHNPAMFGNIEIVPFVDEIPQP